MTRRFNGDAPAAVKRLPNWPARSLVVAILTWVVGHGGHALWNSRTVIRPPMQADYGHDLGLLAVALLTLLFGPMIGMELAVRSLRRQPSRRFLAALALLLNLWVWGLPLLMTGTGYAHRGLVWRTGIGVAAAGVLAAGYLALKPVREAGERRGFAIEATGLPSETPDER